MNGAFLRPILAAVALLAASARGETLSLDGRGRLRARGAAEDCACSLPGDVVSALVRARRIENPDWGRAATNLASVATQTWEIVRAFELKPDFLAHTSVVLRVTACGPSAALFVNGHALGPVPDPDGLADFEVKPFLRAGENELRGVFAPCATEASACDIGFRGGAALVAEDAFRVTSVSARQDWKDDLSEVTVRFAVSGVDVVRGVTQRVAYAETVRAPELWWPNGLGDQPLTDFAFDVCGRTVTERLALRKLDPPSDPDGAWRVNNVTCRLAAAVWRRPDAYAARRAPGRYRDLLFSAAQANLNALVLAADTRETDDFRRPCDGLGLLVLEAGSVPVTALPPALPSASAASSFCAFGALSAAPPDVLAGGDAAPHAAAERDGGVRVTPAALRDYRAHVSEAAVRTAARGRCASLCGVPRTLGEAVRLSALGPLWALRESPLEASGGAFDRFNEGAPRVTSAAVAVDYAGRATPLLGEAQRLFAPIRVAARADGRIVGVNVTRRRARFPVSVEYWDFGGRRLAAQRVEADLPPGTETDLGAWVPRPGAFLRLEPLVTEVNYVALYPSERLFAPWTACPFASARIRAEIRLEKLPRIAQVTLTADRPAFFVWAEARGFEGRFSENALTLLPGRPVTLTFVSRELDIDIDEFRRVFRAASLLPVPEAP